MGRNSCYSRKIISFDGKTFSWDDLFHFLFLQTYSGEDGPFMAIN